MARTLMTVRDLHKHFPIEAGLGSQLFGEQQYTHAVDGIGFEIEKGEIFGLAGESGCGKSTTARCLMRLLKPTAGEILFEDEQQNIADLSGSELRTYRQDAQMVFQDPYESINDRFTIRKWVREPLTIHDIGSHEEREDRVWKTLEQCGLRPVENFIDQFPHELSGGQRQRVALARAMVLKPSFLVVDEPTSMLDVSVRASVLRVFNRLATEQNVAILYISHDLSLLKYICDRIAIMYQGQLMELGEASTILQNPKHPYTQSLLAAVPHIDPRNERERVRIPGEAEEQIGGTQGCPFKKRCRYRFDQCDEDLIAHDMSDEYYHPVSCHLYDKDVEQETPEYEQ